MSNLTKFSVIIFFLLGFVIGGPAHSLTDLVFLRQKIKDGKLELCVAHTGYGYVNMEPQVGQRNLKYNQEQEFPNLKPGLYSECFLINHPTATFKLIGTDGMGRIKVGPWAYVQVVNNKIKQWSTSNNQIFKNELIYNE